MRKRFKWPQLSLWISLLGFFVFGTYVYTIRENAVSFLTPIWSWAARLEQYGADRPIGTEGREDLSLWDRLQWENGQLWEKIRSEGGFSPTLSPFYEAKVLYRDPSFWSRCFWIDVGSQTEGMAIEMRAPVVVGASLIGMIDYVGKHVSRVRLITDTGWALAVRVARGLEPARYLASELAHCLEWSQREERLFVSPEEKALWETMTHKMISGLNQETKSLFLAKGLLEGGFQSQGRAQVPLLKGSGFNFDYPDLPEASLQGEKVDPIVMRGDLLVTSGLDGVFPPGLWVAQVSSCQKVGFGYDLVATPTARSLHRVETVYVLPAIPHE